MKYSQLKTNLQEKGALADLEFKIRNAFSDKPYSLAQTGMDDFQYLHFLLTGSKFPEGFKTWLGDDLYEICLHYAALSLEAYPDISDVPKKHLMQWFTRVLLIYGVVIYKILSDNKITAASLEDNFRVLNHVYEKLQNFGDKGMRIYFAFAYALREVFSINSILIVENAEGKSYRKLSYSRFVHKRHSALNHLRTMVMLLMEIVRKEIP